jgi:hypothetical protein
MRIMDEIRKHEQEKEDAEKTSDSEGADDVM